MNKNIIIVGIVALIIGGVGGFFGGMQYQKGQATAARAQFAGGFGGGTGAAGGRTRGAGAGANGGMAVRGTIISADSSSITVKLPDGSTKIVILSSTTMIGKATTGSASDLTNGANVTIFGTTNSDGSVTAQNVQVGTAMMFGGRPSGSPQASPAGQ